MSPLQDYVIALIFLALTALAGLSGWQSKELIDTIKPSTHHLKK